MYVCIFIYVRMCAWLSLTTIFSLSVRNEQDDAGRNGRNCLARPDVEARTGAGKYSFSCLADHEQDWHPYPVDLYSALSHDYTMPVLSTCPLHTNSGCRKERSILFGPW